MKICAGCRREAPATLLVPILSLVDFTHYEMCPACHENDAEPLAAIARVVRMDSPGSWLEIPADTRRRIRVFYDGAYIKPLAWAERMRRQQVAVISRDDALVEAMARRRTPEQSPPRTPGWFRRLVAMLIPNWSYA